MRMHAYDLSRVFALVQEQGCPHCHVQLTDHGGQLGALVFFQKAPPSR
jgi:hypothetical protein